MAHEHLTPDTVEALLDAVGSDPPGSGLDGPDRAMLGYVAKLTKRPADMTMEDVAVLREHRFTDRAIHDICAIASYYAFVNRLADGLGVDLE